MDAQSSGLRLVWSAAAALVAGALLLAGAPAAQASRDGDTTPPTVRITEYPSNPTYNVFPRFKFESNEPSSFRCQIDPLDPPDPPPDNDPLEPCNPYEPQQPPQLIGTHKLMSIEGGNPLLFGSHKFCVKATNRAGISSAPRCYSWEVTPPRPKDFNPELTVSASTYRAGAHPDLTVKMKKRTFNHCTIPDPPTEAAPYCEDLYLEQNLKKMVSHLPPGLLSDANATPSYCDPDNDPIFNRDDDEYYPQWRCPSEEARVGTVAVVAQICDLTLNAQVQPDVGCHDSGGGGGAIDFPPPLGGTIALAKYGTVYNARPRTSGPYAGEQGHLIVLWPSPSVDSGPRSDVRIDLSVAVREADAGIDSEVDDMVDLAYSGILSPYVYPAQIVQMEFTLEGATGLEEGHPLLTNPTFCDPQTVDAEFQGYFQNSWREWSRLLPNPLIRVPGQGDGKEVTDSAPYQATNCEDLPYAPTYTARPDTYTPGEPVGVSTVITQKEGEATTKKTVVTLPKGMGINLKSTLKPCPADALARKDCPESSRMGTVEAESRLLPKPPRENSGPLKGNVYLTGREGDKMKLSIILKGFINLRIDGVSGISDDGTITLAFDNQPALASSKFKFNFLGGEKSLLVNPRRCVPMTTTANFTSHSGKTHAVNSSMGSVAGCKEPTFEVDLSEKGRGKKTSVELEVRSEHKPIKEIKFAMSRHLKWTTKHLTSKPKKKKKKKKRARFGRVSLMTDRGELESSLSTTFAVLDDQKRKRALLLEAGKLRANLYRRRFARRGTKAFRVKKYRQSKALRKKTVVKNMFSLKPLPKNDVSRVTVELNPNESKFLRNPKKCKKLHWLAIVKTTDGAKHYLRPKQRAKLNCEKSKKRKRSKRK